MARDAQGIARLFRTTLLIGGASASTLAIGVIRTKVFALLLGPAGLGLLALLNSAVATTSAIFGLGLGFSGVKQLAQSPTGSTSFFRVRSAMRWGSVALGVVGAAVMWALREPIAWAITGSDLYALQVGAAGVAVPFSLLATSQTAILQGERRIAELAKLQVLSAALGAAAAIACVWLLGSAGIVYAVVLPVVVGMACGWIFVRDDADPVPRFARWGEHAHELRLMMGIGLLFLLNSVVAQLSEIWVRGMVGQALGLQAVGHFQAAWSISQYVALALAAMSAEFLPRVAQASRMKERVDALVDEQVSAAWVMTTPIVLSVMAFAPWLVPLLFSAAFSGALAVLKWQLAGDLLRVATVPLVYVLAVYDRKFLYILVPAIWHVAYVAGITLWSREFGLEGVGAAYFIGNAIYAAAAYSAVSWSTGVGLRPRVAAIGAAGLALVLVARALLEWDSGWGMGFAVVCALAWMGYFGRALLQRKDER